MQSTAVYMLVMGRVTDPEKMARYQQALTETGLYAANDGHYVAFGKPVDIFEGQWPDNQAMVIAKFPSLEKARSFWLSDTYQNEVKPLREGAGDFIVSVIPELFLSPE